MCVPQIALAMGPVLSGLGLGAAGATGAAAAAGTLATAGTLAAAGGSIFQGVSGAIAAGRNRAALKAQAVTEGHLTAVQDTRQRSQFARQIAQQRSELVARGVTLDSVTALALGEAAGQEMSFQSQATRSDGQARQIELSASARAARAQGFQSVLKGFGSAAGDLLGGAQDLWPGFMRTGTLQGARA